MIVAGMATMPSRIHTAPRAIASILPQVDRLWLCLDGFDSVPNFANHPKIFCEFSRDHGGLRAEGKFLGLALDEKAEVYVSADDDLLYPKNYVRRLTFLSRSLPGSVAAGCHGSVFRPPVQSYVKDRKVRKARRMQLAPWRYVDLLATNGSVHFVRDMRFDPREWTYRNQVDLNFMEESLARGMRLVTAARTRNWVRALEVQQRDSIFSALLRDDSVQTARVNALLSRPDQSGFQR